MSDLDCLVWRKSSRSAAEGNCVEVAAWRKSSRSNADGNCVEVMSVSDVVAVRDSKDPTGPVLTVTPYQWRSFLAAVRR